MMMSEMDMTFVHGIWLSCWCIARVKLLLLAEGGGRWMDEVREEKEQ
jgi:hypothetical protein